MSSLTSINDVVAGGTLVASAPSNMEAGEGSIGKSCGSVALASVLVLPEALSYGEEEVVDESFSEVGAIDESWLEIEADEEEEAESDPLSGALPALIESSLSLRLLSSLRNDRSTDYKRSVNSKLNLESAIKINLQELFFTNAFHTFQKSLKTS